MFYDVDLHSFCKAVTSFCSLLKRIVWRLVSYMLTNKKFIRFWVRCVSIINSPIVRMILIFCLTVIMESTINNIGRSERIWWLGTNSRIIILYCGKHIITDGTYGISLLHNSRAAGRNIATGRNYFVADDRVSLVFSIESPLCSTENLNHIIKDKPLFSD